MAITKRKSLGVAQKTKREIIIRVSYKIEKQNVFVLEQQVIETIKQFWDCVQ